MALLACVSAHFLDFVAASNQSSLIETDIDTFMNSVATVKELLKINIVVI